MAIEYRCSKCKGEGRTAPMNDPWGFMRHVTQVLVYCPNCGHSRPQKICHCGLPLKHYKPMAEGGIHSCDAGHEHVWSDR